MTDEARRALGKTRRLIFQNVATGVPDESVRDALHVSQLEIDQGVAFVAKKLREYLAIERQPPVMCDTRAAIYWNRRQLLAALARIGDKQLGSDLLLGRVVVQALDHPEMIAGAAHRLSHSHTTAR